MVYKTIDLCAGIGGIRRGFELTKRFQNVLSAEIDQQAARTYKHLFEDDPYNDLRDEAFKKSISETEYDVLLAGFPCQSFSKVGKQLGFRDKTQGTIFFEIADIISRSRPKAIFLENVENLISHDGGATIRTIIETLEDELEYRIIGVSMNEDGEYKYSSKSFLRNSRFFGVPQNRPRAYIMGFNKREYGDAIKTLTGELPFSGKTVIYRDVDDIIEPDVDAGFYMASGYWETLKRHKERQKGKGYGFGYCIVNEKNETPKVANTILATGGSGKERNLIRQYKEGVAGTMVGNKLTPINNEGIRVMTPKEWGRLQGFIGYGFMVDGKETFSFPEDMPLSQQYKQLGNSVTIPVIEEMAKFMLDKFKLLDDNLVQSVYQMTSDGREITKKDIMEKLDISKVQAQYVLHKMICAGVIEIVARGPYSRYKKPCNINISK